MSGVILILPFCSYSGPSATDKPAAPAASTNLFAGFGSAAKKDAAPAGPAANADVGSKPAAPSPFGGFGAPATKPADANASTSLFGGAALSASTAAPTLGTKPSAGSSGLNPNAQVNKTVKLGEPAPSFVKGKTFNEIVERFEQELGTQVKTFKDQAAEVREWDLVLMQNASNVSRQETYCRRILVS
jgi:nuclear pore complex protein Nup62